jgi:glycosyltransferase involved in cell wall biosynthesis
MTRICFIIRQFEEGGAQRQLLTLVRGLDKTKFDITLLSFYSGGHFSEEVDRLAHVKHVCLNKSGRWDVLTFIYRFVKNIRQINPDIMHGYLDLPNCLTIIIKPFFPKTRMIFGVRASDMDMSHYSWPNKLCYKLESFLSRFANTIIVNSKAGYEFAALKGFPKKSMVVIPNGIDTGMFKPDPEARAKLRSELGAKNGETLIGLIGRLDPMKDHPTFLKAAEMVIQKEKNIRFVCAGDGPKAYKDELIALGQSLGISDHLVWTGSLKEMHKVYNALDFVCSSSAFGEGFANVIGEAMASGVPCVVTDVGDSSWIVGDTGVVVPPNNPKALADGLLKCLGKEKKETSIQARLRIEDNFSIKKLVERTESALCQ